MNSDENRDYDDNDDDDYNDDDDDDDDDDDNENLLDVHNCASSETVNSYDKELISFAPGVDSAPALFSQDLFCEELSHPHLFSFEKFGFQVKRHTTLSPNKYFNQSLLKNTKTFSADCDYIFLHTRSCKVQILTIK